MSSRRHAERLWSGVPRRPHRADRRASERRPLRRRAVQAARDARGAARGPAADATASSSCTASSTASSRSEQLLRVRAFFDLYDAAMQLGVLPARGTLGEKALLMLRGFGLRAPGARVAPATCGPQLRPRVRARAWQKSSGEWHCGQRPRRSMIARHGTPPDRDRRLPRRPGARRHRPEEVFSLARPRGSRGGRAYAIELGGAARARRADPRPSSGLRARPRPHARRSAAGAIDTLVVAGGRGVRDGRARRAPDRLAAARRAPLAPGRPRSAPARSCSLARGCSTGAARRPTGPRATRSPRTLPERSTVEPDPIFVRDGNVYTSAGVTAGIDLALALVEEDLGPRGRARRRPRAGAVHPPPRRAGAVQRRARRPGRVAARDPRRFRAGSPTTSTPISPCRRSPSARS